MSIYLNFIYYSRIEQKIIVQQMIPIKVLFIAEWFSIVEVQYTPQENRRISNILNYPF